MVYKTRGLQKVSKMVGAFDKNIGYRKGHVAFKLLLPKEVINFSDEKYIRLDKGLFRIK